MVWRFFGTILEILRRSCTKPRSSIWSASSRTRKRTVVRPMARRATRSSRRPGVATRMSVPFSSCSCCLLIDTPPTTRLIFSGRPLAKDFRLAAIWLTSSRVGARISERVVRLSGRVPSASRRSISGRPKAAVLPVPVWARPIRSRPSRRRGIACAWIGVGVSMPSAVSVATICLETPRDSKFVKANTFRGARKRHACMAPCHVGCFWRQEPRVIWELVCWKLLPSA
ncbi:hypothetical protein D3C80_468460 [compost metagenome]